MATQTQLDAWQFLGEKLAERQKAVFEEIRLAKKGLTLFELTERLKLPINQISGRVTELQAKGFVQSSGERRTNPATKKQATVWIVAPKYNLETYE